MTRRKIYSRIILVTGGLAVLLLSGCAAKKENPMVVSARETFSNVQNDSNVNRYAPLELQDAKVAIEKVEKSLQAGDDMSQVEHLAYLSKQKSSIAGEVAAMKIADKEVESASAERNKILLAARNREVEHSLSKAEIARQDAEAQRLAADKQRLAAEEQRRAAEEALKQAQLNADAAEKARMEAAAAEARAKQLEAEIADLQAKQTDRGIVLTLGDVLFDTGKSDLKPSAYANIDKLVAFLKKYPERKVQVEGFTDSVGTENYNLGLSINRAEAVRNALYAQGIEGNRVQFRGYGEMYPVASNDNATGRQLNRRVEIIISDDKGVIPQRMR
ncbi:MAG: OmpA family protein [Pseudomonadota bacterium]